MAAYNKSMKLENSITEAYRRILERRVLAELLYYVILLHMKLKWLCEDSKFIRIKSCHSFLWKIDVDQGLGKLIEQLEQDDEALMKTSVL